MSVLLIILSIIVQLVMFISFVIMLTCGICYLKDRRNNKIDKLKEKLKQEIEEERENNGTKR